MVKVNVFLPALWPPGHDWEKSIADGRGVQWRTCRTGGGRAQALELVVIPQCTRMVARRTEYRLAVVL
jgi:hypothetical protein